jgi:hypothetical protein
MNKLNIEGYQLRLPAPGERYGVENLKAVAILAAKAAALVVSIVEDGKINVIEAISVFRFIRKNNAAATAIDWEAIKAEVVDLDGEEVKLLATAINEALGANVAASEVVALVASVADAIGAVIDIIDSAKEIRAAK